MKEDKEVFFVGIYKSSDLRRNIREALKYSIENLQSYEKLIALRAEKDKNTSKLKGILRYISGLVNNIKDELPKTGLKAKPKPKEVKKEVKKIKREVVADIKKVSELDRLEKELMDIESKLNSLA